jgi:hypothetical protein
MALLSGPKCFSSEVLVSTLLPLNHLSPSIIIKLMEVETCRSGWYKCRGWFLERGIKIMPLDVSLMLGSHYFYVRNAYNFTGAIVQGSA